ncbi:MAG: hypothetical protein J6M57_05970, partial [Acidaminococcaceae bacterium]|nr:hypothetical protein [Acidaminococcaceae bacterium]
MLGFSEEACSAGLSDCNRFAGESWGKFKKNSFVQRFLKQIEVIQKVILDNPFSLFYNIPVTR